ncbi:GPI mannosyltransferase 2-like [Saccostrea echinata]|uniref:GPI mannosyltransferase 2-like n=1 Tax=Saccostrea echinata TaxID=191078 RepID=UPI002A7ECD3C|nr:GPI mannosyltransferase 2-like [Saccostrea echinata]
MAVLDRLERKITTFAIQTRCILLILQIVLNAFFPDHDASVFNPPTNSVVLSGVLDKFVETALSGLNRWDAVYFMHVAEHGYIYQNSLAFFPLFPFLVRFTANTLFYPLQFLLIYKNVLMISAVFCNVFLFILTVKLLFRLGCNVLGNTYIAYKACLLFCINPASIFMIASYSEILYFFLAIYGLLNFENSCKILSVFWFALGTLARSNGLINFGFILYESLIFLVKNLRTFISGVSEEDSRNITLSFRVFSYLNIAIVQLIYLFTLIFLFLVPFFLYQIYYISAMFCKSDISKLSDIPDYLIVYGRERDYHIIGDNIPPWCNSSIPLSYGYVQSSHWGVGFMKYYEFKQIPNFLLAIPVTLLSIGCVLSYYKWNKKTCQTLGVKSEIFDFKKNDEGGRCVWNNPRILPYVCHILVLTVFGWMFVHIQVLTRLLFSASPILYWFSAYCTTGESTLIKVPVRNEYEIMKKTEDISKVEKGENLKHSVKNIITDQIMNFSKQMFVTKLILAYFPIYFVVGTFMYCNFLPWT